MGRLHIFDMDGTLMHGSSASMELARELGLVAEFRELEHALGSGLLDPPGYAERAYELWRALTPAQVATAFEGAPWLAGIREVWADIAARGEHCAVVSLSPDFFVRRLLEWGRTRCGRRSSRSSPPRRWDWTWRAFCCRRRR